MGDRCRASASRGRARPSPAAGIPLCALLLAAAVGLPSDATAQQGPAAVAASGADQKVQAQAREGESGEAPAFASPFLRRGHWAFDALRRLHAHGLLPAGYDPSTLSVTRREAARLFAEGRREASLRGWNDVEELVRGFEDRFAEEFRSTAVAVAGGEPAPGFQGGSSATFGYEGRDDVLLARTLAMDGERMDPAPADDVSEPGGQVDLALNLYPEAPQVAVQASVRREMGDWSVRDTYGLLAFGEVGFWFGRRAPGFGPGDGGGLVLAGSTAYTGGGLFLTDGTRLPGPFKHLGSWRVEAFGTRLAQSGTIDDPWFFGMRASVAPHRRVRIGLNRGVMFAGSNNEVRPTVGRVAKALLGFEVSEEGTRDNWENQVAALDLWVAPPLGRVPLSLYVEYAVEDIANSLTRNPAVLGGVRIAALPGLPQAGLGFEVAHFEPADAGAWYDHRVFGTWTDEGDPMGHPLAGEGTEWRVFADLYADRSRLRLRPHLVFRDRGEENLYAPNRLGEGWGVGGVAEYRLNSHLDVVVRGESESGDLDWTQGQGFLGFRALF